MSEKIRVMVTAVGGGGHGEQILKALRLADGDRYHVVAADARSNQPQFDMADENTLLPLASDPSYIEKLLASCKAHGIQALFHGCEPELRLFADNLELLKANDLFVPINRPGLIRLCMNKERANERLGELGFTPPRSFRLGSRDDVDKIDWWPAIVKPSVGSGGSANCYIAQSSAQVHSLMDFLGGDLLDRGLLLQEYVGTDDDEFTVGVLHDLDGGLINSIAIRRTLEGQMNVRLRVPNQTPRTDLGEFLVVSSGISQGRVGKFPEVTRQCEEIATALGSCGPMNIQCRFVDGRVRVFEINPRYSGTTSLRAMAGYNEPDLMIRYHLLGENIERHAAFREVEIIRHLKETIVAAA
jgi:carbamoyl-phosphate synthase large subunit